MREAFKDAYREARFLKSNHSFDYAIRIRASVDSHPLAQTATAAMEWKVRTVMSWRFDLNCGDWTQATLRTKARKKLRGLANVRHQDEDHPQLVSLAAIWAGI